jgi:hypothetical protein
VFRGRALPHSKWGPQPAQPPLGAPLLDFADPWPGLVWVRRCCCRHGPWAMSDGPRATAFQSRTPVRATPLFASKEGGNVAHSQSVYGVRRDGGIVVPVTLQVTVT